jgi:hypothetical protein
MTQNKSLPRRIVDDDGATLEVFDLPTDETSLLELLRELFVDHWADITFGPIIQGAAWEMKAAQAPSYFGVLDGYLTIAFGAPHFHICIGATKGPRHDRTAPALAKHRQTARAEMFRRLDRDGAPISWGVWMFNGHGEQQITILLPNPFLAAGTDKKLKTADWSRLALWDALRARWFGLTEPDPADRAAGRFRHG